MVLFLAVATYIPFQLAILKHDREDYRNQAQKRGITVEQFREEDSKGIERLWLPSSRFVARRHLEAECKVLTRRLQKEKDN